LTAQLPPPDRKRYRRVRAPILVRPARLLGRAVAPAVKDGPASRLRSYTDETYSVGARLELELVLPGDARALAAAEVDWVERLAEGGPARFDVGMRVTAASRADLEKIEGALDDA
jgi:hypothetical protein